MHKTSTALAALLLLAACSAAARADDLAAGAEISAAADAAPVQPSPALAAARSHAAAHETRQSRASLDALSCEVRSRPTANGVLISANLLSERDLSGEYEMVITKSGGGGSADINQGGPFSVRAGAATALGETEIGLERNARVHVSLRLTSDDGQTCTRSFRL